MSKKVVELRELVKKYDLPDAGKLRTKRALCDAIERYESTAEEEEEESDTDSILSIERPDFSSSFPSVQHTSDQFHWQKDAVKSKLNGYRTINLPRGSTFWHGTNLLFPDGRLPFGVSFYGDIGTASQYAEIRARHDNHGFARVLSAVSTRPLAIVTMNAKNVVRMRERMASRSMTRTFIPLLEYAFPLGADGKSVSRDSAAPVDAALNFGVQILLPEIHLDGWCAIDMKKDNGGNDWHDEICFLHDTGNPLIERGPEQLFLVPRYPHTLLHFHNGAFCGFIDTRDAQKPPNQKQQQHAIDHKITNKSVPEAVLGVPEIAHVFQNVARMDADYMALENAEKAADSKATLKKNTSAPAPAAAAAPAFVATKNKSKSDKNNNPLGLPPSTRGKLIDRDDLVSNLRF